jgi:hypothetical protein
MIDVGDYSTTGREDGLRATQGFIDGKRLGNSPVLRRKMDRESEKYEIKGLPRERSDVQSMLFRNPK